MDATLEKMLERVRGLLALAEDEGATTAEAELATARAAEIMSKYSIDAAMLAAKADVREVPCDKTVSFPNPYAKQHMFLYVAILRAFGGDAVIIESPRRGRSRQTLADQQITLHVYGFEADLMAVDILYTSLYQQGLTRVVHVPPYQHAKTWRVSFWTGFTNRISERLTEAHKSAEATSGTPGTALVLRDRKAMVQAKKAQDYPKLSNYSGSSARSADGYTAGQEAGARANLHNTKSPSNTRRAPALM
jgi:hypothetical protein